jgi:hypothetical protein
LGQIRSDRGESSFNADWIDPADADAVIDVIATDVKRD